MQAKDISTADFLRAVIVAGSIRKMRSTVRWDVQSVLAGHPEHVDRYDIERVYPAMPEKVVMAKANRLIRRGIIDGCPCGCRGDYEIMPETAAELGLVPAPGDRSGSHEPYGYWIIPSVELSRSA